MTARPSRVVLRRHPAGRPPDPPPSAPASAPVRAERPWPEPDALAAVGAAAVLAVSAGDVFVAVLALCVAGGAWTGATAGLAAAAAVARWGTADLGAIAGDQAVLGLAVATGDGAARVSSAVAALALVLAAHRPVGRWPWATPAALGLGAAALAGGPAVGRTSDLLVRVLASAAGVALALAVARRGRGHPGERRLVSVAAVGAAALGLALAVWA